MSGAKRIYYEGGVVETSEDNLGAPGILLEQQYYVMLVPLGSVLASRLRLGDRALAAKPFNFKRVIVRPVVEGNDIVFYRYNGEEAYRLRVAGRR